MRVFIVTTRSGGIRGVFSSFEKAKRKSEEVEEDLALKGCTWLDAIALIHEAQVE